MTFAEDLSRARTRHAAQNMATLRHLGLNLLRQYKTPNLSLRQKRWVASKARTFLMRLLGIYDAFALASCGSEIVL